MISYPLYYMMSFPMIITQKICIYLQIIFKKTMSVFKPDIYKNKIILISGGATGICYEISKQFLLHGGTVYIISRKIENINKAIESLKKETKNSNVFGISCDVRDEKAVQATVKTVVEKFGRIDVLVNGAAGNFLCPVEKLSANAFKTVLMIDTVGTFLLSKYTNQHGFKQGGVIINISAYLHQTGVAMQVHAGSAKAGVDAITRHLAVELGPKNVRVVGIIPGAIEGTQGFDRLSGGNSFKDYKSLVPLQRFGRGEDIAKSAIFLASDAASYISGQPITVDGGISLTFPNFPFLSNDYVKSWMQKANL